MYDLDNKKGELPAQFPYTRAAPIPTPVPPANQEVRVRWLLVTTALALSTTVAQAHHRHRYHHGGHNHATHSAKHRHHSIRTHATSEGAGGSNAHAARARGLPWCGAFMADVMHVTGALARELWVASAWAREYGHATTAHIGAIVVWRHHVGKIVGGEPGRWEILSGNDGGTARTRVRSVAGAIAFRE